MSVKNRKRPPLYWKTWLIAGPGVLIGCAALISGGHVEWALALVLLALVLFFVPWLFTPYSKTARRITRPSAEAFRRSERVADWLGSIPVLGVIWRGAERVTGNDGRREAEEYRRWLRQEDDDTSGA
jgi:hypothetical protein